MLSIKSNILSRYLAKELASTAAVVTFILLLIFLSQQLVRFLSYAASGKIAANILIQLMGFEIPYLLAFLLPLGVYLAIIWAYGGLYANNELRVMHACGFSIKRLFAHTGVVAALIMVIVCVLTMWLNPWLARAKDQIIAKGLATDTVIDAILPGRFQVSLDGKRVVYVEHLSRNHKQANNVFIASQKGAPNEVGNDRWTIVSAERGYQVREAPDQSRFLVTEAGARYEGMPGQSDYKIIHFQKYKVLVPDAPVIKTKHRGEGLSMTDLWKAYHFPENAAELQWRLSIPLSVLLLAVLAVPLSQVKPRQGRYLQLFVGVLIYVGYMNLLFLARDWVEQGMVSVSVGMWWVHLILLVCIVCVCMIRLVNVTSFMRRPT